MSMCTTKTVDSQVIPDDQPSDEQLFLLTESERRAGRELGTNNPARASTEDLWTAETEISQPPAVALCILVIYSCRRGADGRIYVCGVCVRQFGSSGWR